MRVGSAAHLYAGAMIRGRSGRTVVAWGFVGLKVSAGHATALAAKVGLPKTAVLVWIQQGGSEQNRDHAPP